MKTAQFAASDEYHLKQRNKIETLFSLLKGKYHLISSKARSIEGYLAGIYASFYVLISYAIKTSQPFE